MENKNKRFYSTKKRVRQTKQRKFLAVFIALLIAVGVPAVLYQGLLAEIQLYVLDMPQAQAKATQKPVLSVKESVYGLLIENGLNFDEAMTAMAIIQCESAFQQYAVNKNTNGTFDLGIVQFNTGSHKEVSRECAFNIECAIKEMVRVYRQDKNFHQWSCLSKI